MKALSLPRFLGKPFELIILLCIGHCCSIILAAEINPLLADFTHEEDSVSDETNYLPLSHLAKKLDSAYLQDDKEAVIFSRGDGHRLEFEIAHRRIRVNGVVVYLGFPVRQIDSVLSIRAADWHQTLLPVLHPQMLDPVPPVKHIVLDAGHGGQDPGATGLNGKLLEKEQNLLLAKALATALEVRGYRVSLTREDDTFIPLAERSRRANEWEADLFLCLHYNGAEDPDKRGIETFTFNPINQPATSRTELNEGDSIPQPGHVLLPWSTLLAYHIQSAKTEAIHSPDRGVKRARFTVLRDLQMPGVLIEGGFMSNEEEALWLSSKQGRSTLVNAIVEGIERYNRAVNPEEVR